MDAVGELTPQHHAHCVKALPKSKQFPALRSNLQGKEEGGPRELQASEPHL